MTNFSKSFQLKLCLSFWRKAKLGEEVHISYVDKMFFRLLSEKQFLRFIKIRPWEIFHILEALTTLQNRPVTLYFINSWGPHSWCSQQAILCNAEERDCLTDSWSSHHGKCTREDPHYFSVPWTLRDKHILGKKAGPWGLVWRWSLFSIKLSTNMFPYYTSNTNSTMVIPKFNGQVKVWWSAPKSNCLLLQGACLEVLHQRWNRQTVPTKDMYLTM